MRCADFDICECGDYRHQHHEKWATCTMCGDGPTGAPLPCRQFRIHLRMTPTWEKAS